MTCRIRSFLAGVVFLAAAAVFAAQPGPCDTPAHRAFDFWLGDWQVHTPDGKLAGHNRVESRYGGCVVHEHYTSATSKYQGESLNIYDASRKVWHQTWVDNCCWSWKAASAADRWLCREPPPVTAVG